MRRTIFRKAIGAPPAAGLMMVLVTMSMLAACSTGYLDAPPALPPAYFDCSEVEPQKLVDAYYAPYMDINGAQRQYSNRIFVLKGIELTEAMQSEVGQSYIWAGTSVIKCYCVNIADLRHFRTGDRLDIVGVNQGISEDSSVLVFTDCYLMRAGTLALPAQGSKEIISGY